LPLTPFNTFGLRCAALGPGQAEAAYHRCGSARPGGYVKKELVDRAGAGSLAFPRLQICEGVMPGKTRKRGGGGRATGGPGAASSRWRGSWPQLDDDTLPPQSQSNRSVRNFFTDCILATMPLGSAAYEAERTASGEVRIWLAADVVTSSVPCVGRAKATATSFCDWRPMASRANAQRPDQTARLSNLNFEGA
jgi:hypothetical protein